MCLETDFLHLPSEDHERLNNYLTDNQPKIMKEFYDLEIVYLGEMDSGSASDKACEELGHPHGGYWFKRGDKESRLEWLDKQIASC